MIMLVYLIQLIYTVLFYLLIFLAGAASVVGAFIYFLTKIDEDVAAKKNELSKVVAASYEEMKKHRLEREKLQAEKDPTQASPSMSQSKSPQTWVKFAKSLQDDLKNVPWTWGVLKNNMLFEFTDEKAIACARVICLDGCDVSAEKTKKKGKPIWKANNSIIVTHPERSLYATERMIVLHFQTGKDFEVWYSLITRAATLRTHKETEEEKYQSKFWSEMSSRLTNHNTDFNPHWITAVFCRFLWRIHDSEGFLEFLTEKFMKKLDKVNKPSFLKALRIQEVTFGPNLPVLNSVKLLSVSEAGEVQADVDFTYHGGFHVTIEIVLEIPVPTRKLIFPATFSVEIKHFAGHALIFCTAPPSNRFWLGFHGEPKVELEINTEFGDNKYSIRNLPKLANIIINKVKSELLETMVLPNMDDWPIPKIDQKDKGKPTSTSKQFPQTEDIDSFTELGSYVDDYEPDQTTSGLTARKPSSKDDEFVELSDMSRTKKKL